MLKSITLEISLKPFYKTDEASIKKVCRGVFDQWRALLRGRETIAVMLWASDGSEILDYAGSLDDTFEWAKYVGTANNPDLAPDDPPRDLAPQTPSALSRRCAQHDLRHSQNNRCHLQGGG